VEKEERGGEPRPGGDQTRGSKARRVPRREGTDSETGSRGRGR